MAEQSVPTRIDDIATGPALAPEARKDARRNKTPSARLERVEERLDVHDVVLAKVSAQMDGQDDVLGIIKGSVERLEQRSDVVFTGRMAVHTATQTAAVAVQTAAETAAIADAADKARNRRKRWTQIIGFVTAGGGLIELLHQLGVLR